MKYSKRRKFTVEFKTQVCEEIESGIKTQAQISREHGVGNNLISNWIKKYRKDPINCFTRNKGASHIGQEGRVRDLEAALGRATLENQILKKANSYLKAISQERRFTK